MNVVYLLLGSNLSDRFGMLQQARREISARLGTITLESSVYESEAWGFISEQFFLNQVIRIETDFSPLMILEEILKIELEMGRTREEKKGYSSRIIDIDILFFNNEVINEVNLTIPHPRLQDRMFALLPLSEIDLNMVHPGSNKSVGEMISECRDESGVYPYQPKTY